MRASKLRSASGQSMLEFVLMMPFLIIVFFGVFEWSQILVKNIRLSTISRETALAINRNCISPSTATAENSQTCLDQVRDSVMARVPFVFPDFSARGQVIITLYNSSTGAVIATSQTPGSFATRYTPASITGSGMNPSVFGVVGVSEVYYDNPLHTPLESMLDLIMPRVIYKSTVV